MRSARTGKYQSIGNHCLDGGRIPRPRSSVLAQPLRRFCTRFTEAFERTGATATTHPDPPSGALPRSRGPLLDPVPLTERLLQRGRFVAAPGHNLLAAAWPLFYRRITQGARDRPRRWWAGPALLQLLFAHEHNVVYRELARTYPRLSNAELHSESRNTTIALLDKIHMQWRASLLAPGHRRRPHRLWRRALSGLEIGRSHPSSLDRLLAWVGPLLPDRFDLHSAVTGTRLGPAGGYGFIALSESGEDLIERHSAVNLWYSLGVGEAGAFQLANHCAASRRLPASHGNGFENPLAQAIEQQRRSHPASYNALRKLLDLPPVRGFADLDPRWTRQLETCYTQIDDLDALIGLLAERRGPDCAIGETAVRCITVFDRTHGTDRRLSDLGAAWVRENALQSVLLRHYPLLQDALYRIENPFTRWRCVSLIVTL